MQKILHLRLSKSKIFCIVRGRMQKILIEAVKNAKSFAFEVCVEADFASHCKSQEATVGEYFHTRHPLAHLPSAEPQRRAIHDETRFAPIGHQHMEPNSNHYSPT
jgi:hypothetical protein